MQTEQRFLGDGGLVNQWPTKHRDKLLVLAYLASKFKLGINYSEQEVNETLKQWHTFSDWPLLRRELYQRGFMDRTNDGSCYLLTRIRTTLDDLVLVAPNVERDATIAVGWLAGSEGRETLRLMGNTDDNNKPSLLAQEQQRLRDFLTAIDQRTWMLMYSGTTVGVIWVELVNHEYLRAPAVHIMIGDPAARGKGIGAAAIQTVIRLLIAQDQYDKLYSRHLTSNQAVAGLLRKLSFVNDGEAYDDKDGLNWQNVSLSLR